MFHPPPDLLLFIRSNPRTPVTVPKPAPFHPRRPFLHTGSGLRAGSRGPLEPSDSPAPHTSVPGAVEPESAALAPRDASEPSSEVLLCSLFDLLWEVLGAEKVLRRDVEEDEGPATGRCLEVRAWCGGE